LIPEACIGVDVIVGFPTETEKDFIETYDLIDQLEISYLHVFTYSERLDTKALKLKPIINKSSTIINIPRWRAHDIDTLEDWKQAEIIYKSLMKKKYD